MKALAYVLLGLSALVMPAASVSARAAKPLELPTLTSLKSRAPTQVPAPRLKAHAVYQASVFPLALRVTVPAGAWSGAQGRTLDRGNSETEKGPYGWVEFMHPLGAISIITAYGRTPSVAAIVAGLRTRGTGATYEPVSPAQLAGYSGMQLDGKVVGPSHHFVPFTPPSGKARYVPDSYELNQGDVFHIVVVGVRGKTAVVYLTSSGAAADRFPAFLAKAAELLGSLRFPG